MPAEPASDSSNLETRDRIPAHALAQQSHFIRSARQRFGLKLTPERYRHLVRKVEEMLKGTQFIGATKVEGRTCWRIRAGGLLMAVIYDEGTERLVTCFPLRRDQPPPPKKKKLLRLKRHDRAQRSHDYRGKVRRLAMGE